MQGVGYRAWVEDQARAEQARRLGAQPQRRQRGGAVLRDRATVVAEMVALCRHGPPSARVDSVTSETAGDEQLKLRYAGERFSVLPTI